jgi:hypothetical protein
MRRLTIAILVAALAIPAAAYAAVREFAGEGTDDDKVVVKFDLRGKREIKDLRVKDVRYRCQERDKFRARPPEFPDPVKVDKKGRFEDKYALTDREQRIEIKFKARVEGKLIKIERGDRDSDKKGSRYNKAKGTLEFSARYKSDGDRCESKVIDWKAKAL